jgi:RTX calcium-binding nonapeptide repeat (4 copies)
MSRSRVAVLLARLVVLLAALPAAASAAEVKVDRLYYKADYQGDRVVYVAHSGETNEVVLTREGATLLVEDRVPIAPGPGCASESETTVRCSVGQFSTSFAVWLFDGNDEVRVVNATFASLNGGEGDDLLFGLDGAPTSFLGGAGRDTMVGGEAGDTFEEGKAGQGSDTISGGGNRSGSFYSEVDRVSYEGRRSAVRVDLAGDRDDGAAGERDLIAADVESITGGNGPDVLTGGLTRNVLEGGPGRDTVRGHAGADLISGDDGSGDPARSGDRLFGGSGDDGIQGVIGADLISPGIGRDWIEAGDGADVVRSRDASADVVDCGEGRDTADQDRRDFLVLGCERRGPRHPAIGMPVFWADAGDRLTLLLACPSGRLEPCVGQIGFDPGAPVVPATRAFWLSPGSVSFMYVPLVGRDPEARIPALAPAVLELSSTDSRGRRVRRVLPLSEVADRAPLPLQAAL